MLLLVGWANLRGVKEAGRMFSTVRYFVPRLASKAGTLSSGSMD